MTDRPVATDRRSWFRKGFGSDDSDRNLVGRFGTAVGTLPLVSPGFARQRTAPGAVHKSFGAVLGANKGFGPGFDFMRVFLAVSVLAWHSFQIAHGSLTMAEATPLWFMDYSILPMFFGLSGFLVAGSGMRLSLRNFLINRGLRIVPALAVEVLFSALILGPIFTVLPLSDYFTRFEFWHYLTNMVGIINYYLPGVFVNNAITQVNYALWTVPYEIGCYVILSTLMVTGLLMAPRKVALVTAVLMLIAVPIELSGVTHHVPRVVDLSLKFAFLNGGAKLFPSFLLGVLAYQWRDRIPHDIRIFAGCVILCVAIALFGNVSLIEATWLHLIGMPALVYIVVFAGLSKLPHLPIYRHGDYSYGIYLYHVPFLQAIVSLTPGIATFRLFATGLVLMTGVAALSWHFIEKPILALRKRFSFVAQARGVA